MQQQKSTLKRQIIKKQRYLQKLKLLKGKGREQECACGQPVGSLWAALCLLGAACLQRRELTEVTWS